MMHKAFAEIAAKDKRPMARRMRELLPQIEAFVAGHRHADIHSALVNAGLALSFKNYKRELARLRKEVLNQKPGRGTATRRLGASTPQAVRLAGSTNTPGFDAELGPVEPPPSSTLVDTASEASKFFDPRRSIDPFNRKGSR